MEKKELVEGFVGLLKAIQLKFLPDVVEVKLKRNETQCELCYKEYFTYLPKEIQDYIIPITLKISELFLKRMEIECELTRIEQGVEINIRGAPDIVVSMPLVEILVFGTTNMEKAKNLTAMLLKMVEITSSGRVIHKWDEHTQHETEQVIKNFKVAMRFAGVSTIEELLSLFSEKMLDAMLQQSQ